MLVPPSWDKGIHVQALRRVWEVAFNHLRIARQWVFIGTSLPNTDQYLRYLFAVALKHNDYLRHVVVVDPGKAENIKALFEHRPTRIRFAHIQETMTSALNHLFRQLQCYCPDKTKPYEW